MGRPVAHYVVPFEHMGAEGVGQKGIRLGQRSDEGVARERVKADHDVVDLKAVCWNLVPADGRSHVLVPSDARDGVAPAGGEEGGRGACG